MGKINRLNTLLPNGDSGRDCEVEKWCGEPAYQLSASDTPTGQTLTTIQPYKRLIRYKCANGHRFDKTFKIKKDLLTNELVKTEKATKPNKERE